MFDNPGKKVITVSKIVFWVFSSLVALFNTIMAINNSAIVKMVVDCINEYIRIVYMFGGYLTGSTTYHRISAGPFIALIWVIATFMTALSVILIYWVTLTVLTLADSNAELKEINGAKKQGEVPYQRPKTEYWTQYQNTSVRQPLIPPKTDPYNQGEYGGKNTKKQKPAPEYKATVTAAPERVIKEDSPSHPQPVIEEALPNYTPPKVENPEVIDSIKENIEKENAKRHPSKEDILSMYGAGGDAYKK